MLKLNKEENEGMVCSLLKSTNIKGIDSLVKWLKESDFFTAPASSKFHLNIEGGLAQHSLNVYTILTKLNKIVDAGLKENTIIITSLLHDVCKIGIYHKRIVDHSVGFTKNPDDLFEYKREDKFPIGHGDKSVILIQKFIELTNEEIALIRWHMGPYDEEFNRGQRYIEKIYPKIKILYLADELATHFLDVKEESK